MSLPTSPVVARASQLLTLTDLRSVDFGPLPSKLEAMERVLGEVLDPAGWNPMWADAEADMVVADTVRRVCFPANPASKHPPVSEHDHMAHHPSQKMVRLRGGRMKQREYHATPLEFFRSLTDGDDTAAFQLLIRNVSRSKEWLSAEQNARDLGNIIKPYLASAVCPGVVHDEESLRMVAFDIDDKSAKGGLSVQESVAWMIGHFGDAAGLVVTPGGGVHMYYTVDHGVPDFDSPNDAFKWQASIDPTTGKATRPAVDIRMRGMWIVSPGTIGTRKNGELKTYLSNIPVHAWMPETFERMADLSLFNISHFTDLKKLIDSSGQVVREQSQKVSLKKSLDVGARAKDSSGKKIGRKIVTGDTEVLACTGEVFKLRDCPNNLKVHSPFRDDNNPSCEVFVGADGHRRIHDFSSSETYTIIDTESPGVSATLNHSKGRGKHRTLRDALREAFSDDETEEPQELDGPTVAPPTTRLAEAAAKAHAESPEQPLAYEGLLDPSLNPEWADLDTPAQERVEEQPTDEADPDADIVFPEPMDWAVWDDAGNPDMIQSCSDALYNFFSEPGFTDETRSMIAIKGPHGSSKTQFASRMIEDLCEGAKNAKVVVITPLRRLCGQVAKRLGLTNYEDVRVNPHRIVVTPNSLGKFLPQILKGGMVDLVVWDEADHSFDFLNSSEIRNEYEILANLQELLHNTRHVMALSADMSEGYAQQIADLGGMKKSLWISSGKPMDRAICLVPQHVMWDTLAQDLTDQETKANNGEEIEPIFIALQSAERPEALARLIKQWWPGLRPKFISRSNSHDHEIAYGIAAETQGSPYAGVGPILDDCDVLIYSPAINTGVSFHRKRVKKIYALLTNPDITAESFVQMITRARNVSDTEILIGSLNFQGRTQKTKVEIPQLLNEYAFRRALSVHQYGARTTGITPQVAQAIMTTWVMKTQRENMMKNKPLEMLIQHAQDSGFLVHDLMDIKPSKEAKEMGKMFREGMSDHVLVTREDVLESVIRAYPLTEVEAKQLRKAPTKTVEQRMSELRGKVEVFFGRDIDPSLRGLERDDILASDEAKLVRAYLGGEGPSALRNRLCLHAILTAPGREVVKAFTLSRDTPQVNYTKHTRQYTKAHLSATMMACLLGFEFDESTQFSRGGIWTLREELLDSVRDVVQGFLEGESDFRSLSETTKILDIFFKTEAGHLASRALQIFGNLWFPEDDGTPQRKKFRERRTREIIELVFGGNGFKVAFHKGEWRAIPDVLEGFTQANVLQALRSQIAGKVVKTSMEDEAKRKSALSKRNQEAKEALLTKFHSWMASPPEPEPEKKRRKSRWERAQEALVAAQQKATKAAEKAAAKAARDEAKAAAKRTRGTPKLTSVR